MKKVKYFIWLLLLCLLLSGCQTGKAVLPPSQNTNTPQKETTSNTQNTNNAFEYLVTNDPVFKEDGGGGMNMWFNRWYVSDGPGDLVPDFTIGGKIYKTGLGIDGLPNDGIQKVNFSLVKYKILKGKYSEISGVFGFDDRTKVKGASKLIILSDEKVIFESPQIDEKKTSIDIKTAIPENTKEITVRMETGIVNNTIPKVVFGDIKVKKAD